jgi:uncharacterized FlgJ-related protein
MKTILLLLLLLLPTVGTHKAESECIPVRVYEPRKEYTTEERIISVLSESLIDVRVQRIILAQAMYESGRFTNNLTRNYNNIFAVHHSARDSLSLGRLAKAEGCMCFAAYQSVEDATRSYLSIIKRMEVPVHSRVTLDEFVSALKSRNYFTAEESLYKSSLHAILKKDSLYINN